MEEQKNISIDPCDGIADSSGGRKPAVCEDGSSRQEVSGAGGAEGWHLERVQ